MAYKTAVDREERAADVYARPLSAMRTAKAGGSSTVQAVGSEA
jgi:hypothetical protein